MELAKTKVQFYEELEDAVPSPISFFFFFFFVDSIFFY